MSSSLSAFFIIPLVDEFEATGKHRFKILFGIVINLFTYTYCCINIIWCFKTLTPLFFNKNSRLDRRCTGLYRYKEQIIEEELKRLFVAVEEENIVKSLVRKSDTLFSKRTKNQPRKHCTRGNTDCYICFRKTAGVINFPCLHTGLCSVCALKLMFSDNRCPFCRTKIKKLIPFEYKENEKAYEQVKIRDLGAEVKGLAYENCFE